MRSISLYILLTVLSQNTSRSQDTLHWRPNIRISWDDFRGQPDSTSEFGAITHASINYQLSYNDTSFSTSVVCYFNRRKSWVRIRSYLGLQHEQGHFDIAALFAHKLKKRIAEYKKYYNPNTVKEDIREIFMEVMQERTEMDNEYDKETNFSRHESQQDRWLSKIREKLRVLKLVD